MFKFERNPKHPFFQAASQPVKQKPLKEEKMLEQILWEESEQEIRENFLEKYGEEPSEGDVRNIFRSVLEGMRKEGLFKQMLDAYLKQKIAKKIAQARGESPAQPASGVKKI